MDGGCLMLSVKLLGEHYLRRASGEDVSAAIHYRKGWALLGYLAVEKGRRHSREDLAQLLWPHLPAGAARTNLRQVVADLNRVFDSAEGLLEVSRESIGLFPVAQVDIDLFALDMANREIVDRPDAESLLRAEQRCRHLGGEFLAGFELDECDEFTEWLQLTRQRLAGLTANALQHLCEQQETAGWLPQAIATARRLTVLDEWNEGHQRRLMGLLAANGQHQQALVAFEVLSASLCLELASEPEAETRALREQIQTARPESAAGVPRVVGGLGDRRLISAVYCEVREPADETRSAEHCAGVLARIGHCLETAGGWVLPVASRTVLACFSDHPDAGGSSLQAAHAVARLRGELGNGVATALCRGLARVEIRGRHMTVLGEPVETALRLCLQAQAGQVVMCEDTSHQLRGTFELRDMGERRLPGVAHPVRIWQLGEGKTSCPPRVDASLDTLDHPTRRLQPQPFGTGRQSAWLMVLEGSQCGESVRLGTAPLVVGRAPDSDLQLQHRTVSRHHCTLWHEGGRYRLRDMDSTNRIRVNDVMVREAELDHGDRIVLGDIALRFGVDGAD